MNSLELNNNLISNSPHKLSKLKRKEKYYKNVIKFFIYFLIFFFIFCISLIIIYKKNKLYNNINSYNYNIKSLTKNIEQINIEINNNIKLNKKYKIDLESLNEKEEIENFNLNNLKKDLEETKNEFSYLNLKLNELNNKNN